MRTHPLIEKAFIYPTRLDLKVSDEYEFKEIRGYWVSRKDNTICITSVNVKMNMNKN